MKAFVTKIIDFINKYPTQMHVILFAWNAFMTSWATKMSVPLESVGLPFSINATAIVGWMQLHTHMPTSTVGIITFALNAVIGYSAWKKKQKG